MSLYKEKKHIAIGLMLGTFLAVFPINMNSRMNIDMEALKNEYNPAKISHNLDIFRFVEAPRKVISNAFVFEVIGSYNTCNAKALDKQKLGEFMRQAWEYANYNDFEKAYPLFNQIIAENPDIAPAYIGRGKAALHLGKPQEAIADLNKAIELDPDNAYYYCCLGSVYDQTGDFDKAETNFHKSFELCPTESSVYTCLINVYKHKGDFVKSREYANMLDGLVDSGMCTDNGHKLTQETKEILYLECADNYLNVEPYDFNKAVLTANKIITEAGNFSPEEKDNYNKFVQYATILRATAYDNMGNYDAAILDCDTILTNPINITMKKMAELLKNELKIKQSTSN